MSLPTVTVSITGYEPTGGPLPNGLVQFELSALDVNGGLVVPEPVSVSLDVNGLGSVALAPNATGTQGTVYNVTLFDSNNQLRWSGTANVPNSNCNLHQILNLVAPATVDDATAAKLAAQAAAAQATAAAATLNAFINIDGGRADSVFGGIQSIDLGSA
jgi:hypothetical protein